MGGYLAYTEYKDSGMEWLGKIPTSWNPIPLKFLVATRKGIAFKSSDFIDSGCKVVKASDIKNNTILDSAFFIDESFKSLFPKAILQKEEIVISTVGSNPDVKNSAVGQIGVVPEYLGESLLNQNTVVFTSKFSTSIQNRFLFYVLISTPYRDHLDLHAHGTANQASLNITDMLSFQIALPSIEEQRSIARFLDYKTAQIDALIAKKETLLKKLAEKRTALISQAVTKGCDRTVPMKDSSIEWLGEIPAHWELVRMRRRWKVIDCKHKTVEFIDEGFPIASIGEVRDHKFNLEQAKRASLDDYLDLIDGRKPEKNDLIYSRNATVGCVGFVDEDIDFCLGQDVCLIKTFTENNRFLWWQLQSISVTDQLQSIFVGATFKRINVADIKAYLVCCPPVDEQQNIAQYLDEKTKVIDQQKVQIEEAIAKLKEYRTALITNAVTGKINVRDVMLELEPVEAA